MSTLIELAPHLLQSHIHHVAGSYQSFLCKLSMNKESSKLITKRVIYLIKVQ